MTVRGRFAPTPSGLMHVGNGFAALLAWLQARQAGGVFVLRLEDTDLARSRAEFAAAILEDLSWLGLDWDEGPDVGGAAEGPAYPGTCRNLTSADRQLRAIEGKDFHL